MSEKGDLFAPPEQRCYARMPGRPCDVCMEKRSGANKACYRPYEKPLHQRNQEKHDRKMSKARQIEKEATRVK